MRRWREKAATVWRTGASGGHGGGGRDPCRPPPAQQRGAGHRGHGRLASASARERGTEATSACRVTGQRLHVREHRYRKPAESGPQAGADHRGHGLRVCEHEGDTDPRGTRQIREGWSGSGGSSSRPNAASRYRRLPARRSARSGGPVAGFAGARRGAAGSQPGPRTAARGRWRPDLEARGGGRRRTRKRRRRPSRGGRTRARWLAGPGVRWRRRAPDRRAGFRVCDGVGFLVLVGFEPGARQRQRAGARRSAPRRFNALKLRVDVRSIEI